MLAQESGEWEEVKALSRQLNLNESEVAESYWQAVQWTHQINAG